MMDWNKVGAIGSLIGAIVGSISFGATIWPYPQFRRWRATNPDGIDAPRIGVPKLIAIPIAISLILSGFSLYAAWHPVARYHYPPDFQHLEKIDCDAPPNIGKSFVNETIEVDGKEFLNCRFINTKLLYHGRDTYAMQHNVFEKSLVLATDDNAIATYGEILAVTRMLGLEQNGISWHSDKSEFWVSRVFPPGTHEEVGAQTIPAN